MPNSTLNSKTPYKALLGKLPSSSHLRVFGSLCYASTSSVNWCKFSYRATQCFFLGYPYGKKGYKVCDIQTKKNFKLRDVIFYEHLFSFHPKFQSFAFDCFMFPSYTYDELPALETLC